MNEIKRAWITTNLSCNLRCKWCYAFHALDNGQELPIDIAKKIVDTVDNLGARKITLIGGEPSLYSELFTLLRYINGKDSDIRTGMTTNGIMLSDRKFAEKLISHGVSGYNISIKGLSENEYFSNTGNGNGFYRMLDGYRNISELTSDVIVSYVIVKEDTEQIDRLYEFCQEHGIKKIMIQFVKPMVQMDAEPIMHMEAMGRLTEYIYKNWKSDIDYTVELSFPICLIDNEVYESMHQEGRLTGGCHIRTGTGINYDINGRVIPCNHFVNLPYLPTPLLSEKEVMDLHNNDMFIRVKEKACAYPSLKCKTCKYWNRCGGGCFTRWFYENPEEIIH